MDFGLTEEQAEIRSLARRILIEGSTHERLGTVESSDDVFDRATWNALAGADLLGLAVPEPHGGSGRGFVELALLLEEVGRAASLVPLLPTLVMGAAPIVAFGSPPQRERILPGVVAGTMVLTAALHEPGGDALRPAVRAEVRPSGFSLDGVKTCVPAGMLADVVLVPATLPEGKVGIFLVDPSSPGVRRTAVRVTNRTVEAHVELDGAEVGTGDLLGGGADDGEQLRWIVEHTTAGLCAVATGICDAAVRRMAEYTAMRKQFGQPIGSFQAARQRAAGAYVDADGVRLTAVQAIWRLANDRPASREVAIAKFWAAEGTQRVVHAAQHLHGGIGLDLDYPLHRYFLWAKHVELTLGGASQHLARLGATIAAEAR